MRKPGSIVHVRRTMRKTIYRLKWLYGFPVDLYRDVISQFDPRTGKQAVSSSKIHIDRCIIFPGTVHRDFFFSISFIKANSNFVSGGDIQIDDRQFLIDAKDLPADYEVKINDYFIWDDTRYDIKSAFNLEENTGYYLSCRKIVNAHNRQIFEEKLWDRLIVNSTFVEVE